VHNKYSQTVLWTQSDTTEPLAAIRVGGDIDVICKSVELLLSAQGVSTASKPGERGRKGPAVARDPETTGSP
jgi:hypothetical protein